MIIMKVVKLSIYRFCGNDGFILEVIVEIKKSRRICVLLKRYRLEPS